MIERPCNCGQSFPGEPYADRACDLCWHAMNSPRYQILWGIDPATLDPMTPEQLAARPKPEPCCGQSKVDLEYEVKEVAHGK